MENRLMGVNVLFVCIYFGACYRKLTTATVRYNISPKPVYRRFNIDKKIVLEARYPEILATHTGRRINSETHSQIWKWDTWCLLQPKEGNCDQKIKRHFMTQNIPLINACRFYYNRQLEGCLPFLYSGCSANENNFETKLDCELRCAGVTAMLNPSGMDRHHCLYQPDVGACLAFATQYFFDVNRNTCSKFIYGGCAGNANRFETKFKCMRTCKQTE